MTDSRAAKKAARPRRRAQSPGSSGAAMSSTGDDAGAATAQSDNSAQGTVTALRSVPTDPSGAPTDLLHESADRHPTALGRHLDCYFAAVARELRTQGVLTGSPQRTDPAERLIGSIVLDCTALRVAAGTPTDHHRADQQSLGAALHPERPAPVVVTWDEHNGWCVGLHDDPTQSSRRYLHPKVLPPPSAVADFVVGLALGQPLGAAHPVHGDPRLRLLR